MSNGRQICRTGLGGGAGARESAQTSPAAGAGLRLGEGAADAREASRRDGRCVERPRMARRLASARFWVFAGDTSEFRHWLLVHNPSFFAVNSSTFL
jgi:hypothetical protein